MTAIDQKQQTKWDEFDRNARATLEIMLDKYKQPGYYGRESLILHAQNGNPTHAEIGSNTTHKA